jgi:integrase
LWSCFPDPSLFPSDGLRRNKSRARQACFPIYGGIKFNEHDIRKTVANEADNLEHAQRLLGHQDAKTTSSTYRIGRPETVRVLINSEKL